MAVYADADAGANTANMSTNSNAIVADMGTHPNAANMDANAYGVRACRAGTQQRQGKDRSNKCLHGSFLR